MLFTEIGLLAPGRQPGHRFGGLHTAQDGLGGHLGGKSTYNIGLGPFLASGQGKQGITVEHGMDWANG